MSKLNLAIVSAVLGLVLLPAPGWAVTNAVVGTCKTGTQFTTIQSAVNAATAGSTVQVCPGIYPELVTVQQNLTLAGLTSNKSDAIVITPPSSGIPANGTSGLFGPLAIQVKIEVADVTLRNISIDGGGPNTTCPSNATWVGVLFQGTVGGSMMNSSVVDAPSCPIFGLAALADATTNFTFTNNALRDCPNVCLEVDFGSQTAVTNNLFNQANPNLAPLGHRTGGTGRRRNRHRQRDWGDHQRNLLGPEPVSDHLQQHGHGYRRRDRALPIYAERRYE